MSLDQPLSIQILGASYGIFPGTGSLLSVGENVAMAATGIELCLPTRKTGNLLHLRFSAVAEWEARRGQPTPRCP